MTTNPTPSQPPAPPAAPQVAAPAAGPAAPISSQPATAGDTAKRPHRLFLTILELAALGVVGSGILAALSAMLGVGLGMLFVFGIGIFILLGLVYALFGVAWFEVRRVSGLYGEELPDLQWTTRTHPGFGGWLRNVGKQSINGPMWRVIVNFVLACIAGALLIRLFWGAIWSAFFAFTPLHTQGVAAGPLGSDVAVEWAPVVGILGVLACTAGIIGLAMLHRLLSRTLVVPNREAELAARVQTTTAQRAGAVRAAELERTRIERDLHDGVQPRLVSVGMTLGLAQQKIDSDPVAAKALIDEAHTSTKAAITELRQLARGIHTSVLDDRGLDAALSALAGRSHIPVQLDVRIEPGLTGTGAGCRDAEAAVYFAIAESLTNAAKHSRASECRVVVRSRDGGLWARVEDNGMGGAQVQPGGGLDGITNRVLAAGGTFRLDSPVGGPTSLEVTVPCAS
ncbi:signal transduction histidine kinase [Microbacterium sp. W4I4]|uniref:sensor histidine kinase n=1 Tax=Microbacterium sp. W4I4 TaxID=3042295 RepID=UPI002780D079|nr:sensor histidine kinase [Microbacterium sp. W4I4]MDQ0614622.1 signal transduction histidine kinase [Microbacterium sp. W4I4]